MRESIASLLDPAREAIRTRTFYNAFPEAPSGKVYGESAAADGEAAFNVRLGTTYDCGLPSSGATVASERSPYGIALDVAYPIADVDAMLAAAAAALPAWSAAGADARAEALIAALVALNRRSFEIAHATMHTTGQAFVMAFQAGGPHAQDRALEAIAYAYEELARVPEHVRWEKPGRTPLVVEKTFRCVPRGIALVIGCSTFPNWNAYPAIFANLMTGNAVVVKPHPQAILPLAITVEQLRATLREHGFDPALVALAVDPPGKPLAKELALDPRIAIVDYTGSTGFGTWLEENARKPVFTEKGGVNPVVIDATSDVDGMMRNLAMSLTLYSGQMCTTPRSIFVPAGGIASERGHLSFDETVAALVAAIDAIVAAPERAVELLGAIATDATLARLEEEGTKPGVVRPSAALAHPHFPQARVRTPLIAVLDAARDADRYQTEPFGPIAYVVKTRDSDESLALAATEARRGGAITALVYATDPAILAKAEQVAVDGMVSLGVNFTGPLLVNVSAAFSDYHVTGGNPSGNASLTDSAFVANRFRIVETRTPVAAS